jgi:hypothetical protein
VNTKLLQFRVRTLLLLTAIMGALFVACARWPVADLPPPPAPGGSVWGLRVQNPDGTPIVVTVNRPPTVKEWAIRATVSGFTVVLVLVLVGTVRRRRDPSTHQPPPSNARIA